MTKVERRALDRATISEKAVVYCPDGVNWRSLRVIGDQYLEARGDTPVEAYKNMMRGLEREGML